MVAIARTCAQKIISLALKYDGRPFVAILPPGMNDCIQAETCQQLQQLLSENPGAYVIYNQHPQAFRWVAAVPMKALQILIEIHQETCGVLGLQARYRNGQAGEVVELVYR